MTYHTKDYNQKIKQMKFAAIFGFLATQSSATTNFQVSVDEQEAMRVAQAVGGRVQQWVGTNQDDLMTA